MITASQIKPGMALRLEGQIYKVLASVFKAGAGQLGGVVKTKLRNVSTGHISEPHIRPADRVEDLDLERQVMEFLYRDEENCAFMNPQTLEQVEIPRAILGPAEKFLREGMKVPVEFFEGNAVSMEFPPIVEARVVDTAAVVHSQQDNTWKEATLEGGVRIQVPLFVDRGEIVRVEVETEKYLERVRAERKRGA